MRKTFNKENGFGKNTIDFVQSKEDSNWIMDEWSYGKTRELLNELISLGTSKTEKEEKSDSKFLSGQKRVYLLFKLLEEYEEKGREVFKGMSNQHIADIVKEITAIKDVSKIRQKYPINLETSEIGHEVENQKKWIDKKMG